MELSLERGQRPLRDIPTAMQRIKKGQLHKKQQQEARSKEWGEGFMCEIAWMGRKVNC